VRQYRHAPGEPRPLPYQDVKVTRCSATAGSARLGAHVSGPTTSAATRSTAASGSSCGAPRRRDSPPRAPRAAFRATPGRPGHPGETSWLCASHRGRRATARKAGDWCARSPRIPPRGFVARAITRNVNSDAAKALAKLGAEVVAATSTTRPACAVRSKVHGAYCVTFFWAHFSPRRDRRGRGDGAGARAPACARIWSTLEDTRNGAAHRRAHADADGQVQGAATSTPRARRTTCSSTRRADDAAAHVFYWDNLIHFGMGPKPAATARWPSRCDGRCALPGIAARTSAAALRHLQGGARTSASPSASRATSPPARRCRDADRALGREVRYHAITPRPTGRWFSGCRGPRQHVQFYRDFERDFCASRHPAAARALNPRSDLRAVGARGTEPHSARVSARAAPAMNGGGARGAASPRAPSTITHREALRPELPRRPAYVARIRRRRRTSPGERVVEIGPVSPRSRAA